MDTKLITKIHNAINYQRVRTLLELIHDHVHVDQDAQGRSYLIYHQTASVEIVEEISAALVQADAGDFFKEICLQGGLDYEIQNFPAGNGRSILDLAKIQDSRSMIEALERQGAVELLTAEQQKAAQIAKEKTVKKFKAAAIPRIEPQPVLEFRQALIYDYGPHDFQTKLNDLAFEHFDDLFCAAMESCILERNRNAAGDYIRMIRESRALISPSTWDKIMNTALAHENYEIAALIRDAQKPAIAALPVVPNPFS